MAPKKVTAKRSISDSKLRKEIERLDRRLAAAEVATRPGHSVQGQRGTMLPAKLTRNSNQPKRTCRKKK